MRERAHVVLENHYADCILLDPNKDLDDYQIAYLTGVMSALKWVIGLSGEPPTKGL